MLMLQDKSVENVEGIGVVLGFLPWRFDMDNYIADFSARVSPPFYNLRISLGRTGHNEEKLYMSIDGYWKCFSLLVLCSLCNLQSSLIDHEGYLLGRHLDEKGANTDNIEIAGKDG
jgi:hypothetical protein